MIKHNHILLLTLGVMLLSVGCRPIYYVPNTQVVPLIDKKGAGQLTLSGSAGQFNTQAAIGITDQFALQLNAHAVSLDNAFRFRRLHSQLYEAGLGIYSKGSNSSILEVYALGGMGTIHNKLRPPFDQDQHISSDFWRYGFQINYGKKKKNIEYAFSSRFIHMTYYNTQGDLVYLEEDQRRMLRYNNQHFFWEPAGTIRIGFDHIKFFYQTGFSINMTDQFFSYRESFGTVGLCFQL